MLRPNLVSLQAVKPPALRPLDRFPGSLANRAYLSLKQGIFGLAFRPGEVLRKSEICETLGVSRSPVSEAVARLAADGLVDVVPQAGTFVARFSMADIREGAFLREALELAAVEVIARTVTEDQLLQLRRNLRLQQALLHDGDFAGFYQTDAQMHELLLLFTGFRRLASLAETAWVHVNRARQLILPAPGGVEAAYHEHLAILAAIESRDPAAARQATQDHLRQLMTFLEPLVETHPEFFAPG
jgi:DNA-binding GntR family transcriptional regulator